METDKLNIYQGQGLQKLNKGFQKINNLVILTYIFLLILTIIVIFYDVF